MRVGANAQPSTDGISWLMAQDSHVLVFEVTADALVTGAGARGPRGEVRLMGTLPGRGRTAGPPRTSGSPGSNGTLSGGEDFGAVLVLHGLTPARLLSCLRALTGGRAARPPVRVGSGWNEEPGRGVARRLTPREFDALRLLAEGATTRDMALRLSYSERTVKTIVHDLLAKLGCRTRAQAVALATREGVI